jgi:hypothetical protein
MSPNASPTSTAGVLGHRIGETGSVTVRVADWDVEVIATDGDVAWVKDAAGDRLPDNLEVERTDDGLVIRQPGRFGFDLSVGRRASTRKLLLEVPSGAAVTVQTASGDVNAARLHGPIRMRTASGDLLLVDVAGSVEVETVSGDIAIRLDGPTNLEVKTVSGETLVEGSRVDHLAFQSTSGDLRLKSELGDGPHAIGTVSGDAIVTSRNGIRVAAQTVAGDLSSELPHTSEGRPGRRSLIVGSGSTVVQFRSVSGDLQVVGPSGDGAIDPPAPPASPSPPTPPTAPVVPAPFATASMAGAGTPPSDPATNDDEPDHAADAHLDVLRALERGEIDIEEAMRRLASLDEPTDG